MADLKTYDEVADKLHLMNRTRERYIKYMRKRWAGTENQKCLDGYAEEWAERFKSGREYECSDSVGQNLLKILDCTEKGLI